MVRGIGYYLNTLQKIKKYLEKRGGRLTQVQTRLITKDLQKSEYFKEIYGIKALTQKRAFINAVIKYTNLSPAMAEAII